MEVKRDTARFDRRQWYVDGYALHWFTTEEDAKAAIALAGQVANNERNELANKIRDALP
jgi:hypothetical protein